MYLGAPGLAFHAPFETYMWRDWGVNIEKFYIVLHILKGYNSII